MQCVAMRVGAASETPADGISGVMPNYSRPEELAPYRTVRASSGQGDTALRGKPGSVGAQSSPEASAVMLGDRTRDGAVSLPQRCAMRTSGSGPALRRQQPKCEVK